MPFLNGKQVQAALKESHELNEIPVVMYFTHFGEQDILEIRNLGAAHFLVKPTGFNALVESLGEILAKEWNIK
jgi:DNA-binding response OmpR family regulator